jgi:hypothetical protein
MAAEVRNFEVLNKLWSYAKELQLKAEELRNEVMCSKCAFGKNLAQGSRKGSL